MHPESSYGRAAGLRLLDRLPDTGVFRAADALAAGEQLHLSETHVRKLLHQLTSAGWLARLEHGLYAPADRTTHAPKAHPFTVATSLVQPSAVSHWSALAHWQLTEQIPQVVTVTAPRRGIDRSRRRRVRARETGLWQVADQRFRVVFVRPEHFFGAKDIWVAETERVQVFEPERAALDTLQHFHVFGSLGPALELFSEHLSELDVDRLAEYATRLRVDAVMRRLGWLLEHLGAAPAARERLAATLPTTRGAVALDPTRPRRGRRSKTWGVIENVDAR
jgi:predicted transcriptional regulator of viral defense system